MKDILIHVFSGIKVLIHFLSAVLSLLRRRKKKFDDHKVRKPVNEEDKCEERMSHEEDKINTSSNENIES